MPQSKPVSPWQRRGLDFEHWRSEIRASIDPETAFEPVRVAAPEMAEAMSGRRWQRNDVGATQPTWSLILRSVAATEPEIETMAQEEGQGDVTGNEAINKAAPKGGGVKQPLLTVTVFLLLVVLIVVLAVWLLPGGIAP